MPTDAAVLLKQLQQALDEIERLENNIALACVILKDFYPSKQEQQIRRALLEGVGP